MLIKTFSDKWIDTDKVIEYEVQMNEGCEDFNVVAKLINGDEYIIEAMFIEYEQTEGLIKQIAEKIKSGKTFYQPRKEYLISSIGCYKEINYENVVTNNTGCKNIK